MPAGVALLVVKVNFFFFWRVFGALYFAISNFKFFLKGLQGDMGGPGASYRCTIVGKNRLT
jgi:hypothetical protein